MSIPMWDPADLAEVPQCDRWTDDNPCMGEVYWRMSRSGLTIAGICELHDAQLAESLDAIATRYPEINHPDGCGCYGCSEGSW